LRHRHSRDRGRRRFAGDSRVHSPSLASTPAAPSAIGPVTAGPAAVEPAAAGPAAAGPVTTAPGPSAIVAPDPGSYAYDAAGRLVGVTHVAGETARYSYDPAGNVTGIARYASSTLSVLSVVPATAKPNATVTISGTGFPTTPGSAVVSFNGVPVTVTPISETTISVNVPPNATTGPLTVRAGGTTAAGGTFTLAPSPPTITGISPTDGPPTTEITITGSGFDPVIGNDVVAIGGRPLDVLSASATSIRAAVPVGVSSGVDSVSAPRGVGNGPDFFVPPVGIDPGLIDSYRRMNASSPPTLVDWKAEPNSMDENGKPTADALPDFVVEVNVESAPLPAYRRKVETFERP
jgi:YD repeat-containing protein